MIRRIVAWTLAAFVALVPALALAQVEVPFFYPIAVSGPITKIVDGLAAGAATGTAGSAGAVTGALT